MKNVLILGLFCTIYASCKTKPIKAVARPKIPICLVDVLNYENALCGFENESEQFEYKSRNVIGTTSEDYLEAMKYVDNLENYIRFLERRKGCK